MRLDVISDYFETDKTKFKFFKVTLPKAQRTGSTGPVFDKKQHLVIKAKSVQENPSDPDVFVSKVS